MSVYVVTQIDFDNLENRDPISEKHLGYRDSEEAALQFVATRPEPRYKGYDGQLYPQYRIWPLGRIL